MDKEAIDREMLRRRAVELEKRDQRIFEWRCRNVGLCPECGGNVKRRDLKKRARGLAGLLGFEDDKWKFVEECGSCDYKYYDSYYPDP